MTHTTRRGALASGASALALCAAPAAAGAPKVFAPGLHAAAGLDELATLFARYRAAEAERDAAGDAVLALDRLDPETLVAKALAAYDCVTPAELRAEFGEHPDPGDRFALGVVGRYLPPDETGDAPTGERPAP